MELLSELPERKRHAAEGRAGKGARGRFHPEPAKRARLGRTRFFAGPFPHFRLAAARHRLAAAARLRLVAALLFLPLASLQAAPPPPNEYSLKAVFLYNFSRFIDWPTPAFDSPDEPFIIGIIGPDPFGPLLDEAIAGENYHGRPIRIVHFRSAREIRQCHLLFVSQGDEAQIDGILAAVAGRNILTVGETEAFLDHGGMIALTAEQNRVRLRINPTALRATKLSVSSKLLQVAEIRS